MYICKEEYLILSIILNWRWQLAQIFKILTQDLTKNVIFLLWLCDGEYICLGHPPKSVKCQVRIERVLEKILVFT